MLSPVMEIWFGEFIRLQFVDALLVYWLYKRHFHSLIIQDCFEYSLAGVVPASFFKDFKNLHCHLYLSYFFLNKTFLKKKNIYLDDIPMQLIC